MSRYEVEALLASTSNLLSDPGRQNDDTPVDARKAAIIFALLTKTQESLIRIHRKQLLHRFHLAFPIYQALIRCLFVPYTGSSCSHIPRPAWLVAESITPQTTQMLSRILTALAEPSYSTVTSNTDRKYLTDPTLKARNYVGRFAPMLLSELVNCHVHGHIRPDIRRILMPGVWAVFNAAPKEILETMHVSLDSDDRGVFKGLWSEWRESEHDRGHERN